MGRGALGSSARHFALAANAAGPNIHPTMSSAAPTSSGPEFYIRGANDAEARGPFSLEQLTSLAEAGQVTAETYFYDAKTEQWLAVSTSAEMKALLWPEKKKLTFKAKEIKALNVEREGDKPITVQEFLDAAEGKTHETKDKSDPAVTMMNAAVWGTRTAALICLIGAAALVLPGIDAVISFDPARIMAQPYVLLGIADGMLGILLLLGVISLYPVVRFRAVFGLGFLGFLFWGTGQNNALLAVAAGSVGLYFSTIFLSYIPLAVAAAAGLGGVIALALMAFF